MKKDTGFSLIELLIVVVVIGIVAAIAIPNLLASRRSANEGSAITSMRTVHAAQMTYASTYGQGEYAGAVGAPTSEALTMLQSRGLIDGDLGTARKSGYSFVGGRVESSSTNQAGFFFSALPDVGTGPAATGDRRFGIASDGVVRADSGTAHYSDSTAVMASTPLTSN